MAQLNYIDRATYFADMQAIDNRLIELEDRVDRLTQSILELLKEENIKSSKRDFKIKTTNSYIGE